MQDKDLVENYYENLYKDSKKRLLKDCILMRNLLDFFSKYVKNKRDKKSTRIIELGCGLSSNLIPLIENWF